MEHKTDVSAGPLRVAVAGCGAVARLAHAPALAALSRAGVVRVVAVCDPLREQAAELSALLPGEPPVVPFEALEAHVADAALVASPAAFHEKQCHALLGRGLHVLCEKPLGLSAAGVAELARAAERFGRVCGVALQRRFWPSCLGIRSALDAGWIGRPLRASVRAGGPFGWAAVTDSFFRKEAAGGGTLLDLGIHLLDIFGVWFGEGKTTGYADDRKSGRGVESTCELTAEWSGGVTGKLDLTREFPAENVCRIKGAEGEIEWNVFDPESFRIRSRGGGWLRVDARGEREGGDTFRLAQERLWMAFVAETRGERTALAAAGDAAGAHRMIDDAYAAARALPFGWSEALKGVAFAVKQERRKRLGVLGASGFVGSRLCEILCEAGGDFEVRPIVRRATGLARLGRLGVDWARADAFDRSSLRKAFAGCDAVADVMMPGLEGIDTAAVNVAHAAAEAGVRRLVYVSTQVVFGPCPPEGTDELTPLPRRSPGPYAEGKRRAEKALAGLARRLGIELVILRPGIVYGPGSRWVNNLADSFAEGAGWLADGGAGVINAIYADNLCQAILLAAGAAGERVSGKVYFVNDAERLSWRDFCRPIAEAAGVDVAHLPGPPPEPRLSVFERALALRSHEAARWLLPRVPGRVKRAVKAALREWSAPEQGERDGGFPAAGGGGRAPVYDAELAGLQRCRWRFANDRAAADLGYAPAVPFAEGMARSLEWWRTARRFAGRAVEKEDAG